MLESKPVVFLLDDERSVVVALRRLLQATGFTIRAFTSVTEFLDSHDGEVPGCLVADVRMPGMTGLELQGVLAMRGCARPVIFVTGQGDIRTTVQAMKAGAVTFLAKPVQRAELIAAVEEAIRLDVVNRARQHRQQEVARRIATLTARERQVLELVLTGRLNKQIAIELGAAEKTIKVHRGRIMDKMQVRTAVELMGLLSRVDSQHDTPHLAYIASQVSARPTARVPDALPLPNFRFHGDLRCADVKDRKLDAAPTTGG